MSFGGSCIGLPELAEYTNCEVTMGLTLAEFCRQLDGYDERVPLDELETLVSELVISPEEVEPYLQFNEKGYQRNLVHEGPACQVLMLCWLNGQRSPIHDHVGSSCAVRVIEGSLLETVFEHGENGMIYATHSNALEEGQICGSQDSDIHQVSNLQDDHRRLVTMHVYSPPLMTMNVYSLTDAEVKQFFDPVHELMYGAGI
ncbi:MAG: cysteine dioxygenase family protein [Phycisphaerales bacterium]|nr:cysteine dioxygenase family protein [Phycisphaerales bacterium]